MLVISSNAKGEAERLGKQSFAVKPFMLIAEQLPSVSSIDGAVLLDKTGDCHALGIILDGHASEQGDSARGRATIRPSDTSKNTRIALSWSSPRTVWSTSSLAQRRLQRPLHHHPARVRAGAEGGEERG